MRGGGGGGGGGRQMRGLVEWDRGDQSLYFAFRTRVDE